MGIDVRTFDDLLERFLARWNFSTIDRWMESNFQYWSLMMKIFKMRTTMAGHSHTIVARDDNWAGQPKTDPRPVGFWGGCILAFAPDGTIMYAILNAPGSWHNSTIAELLYDQLLERTPPGYWIISNRAFPRNSERLQSQILAPVKRGDCLPTNSLNFAQLQLLNEQLVSAHQAAKWGMQLIPGLFAWLKMPLQADNHQYQANLLQVVCRLHQLQCRLVGINQTATVYQSVWDDNHILCRDFHKMLFSEIQG
ncbi:hypothetical protein PTTG_02861 [Puccinia triticina 1-1 BBBD Race 1]|uniref:DDE Tnp4 domain-containing protein n=1 Tax=Puccinia triticina (isolate 1-1 / race 1 (BBBD)) TaxID=630390 RepID=A0A0C4EQ08_PUCT1|nr:hypothetical protein PTTG_02861 [Puccinia triticina 1-1 BBBD Race 1]